MNTYGLTCDFGSQMSGPNIAQQAEETRLQMLHQTAALPRSGGPFGLGCELSSTDPNHPSYNAAHAAEIAANPDEHAGPPPAQGTAANLKAWEYATAVHKRKRRRSPRRHPSSLA